MAEGPKIWDGIYEKLYSPIENWPLRSFFFFAVWFAAGWWLRYKFGFPEKPESVFITLFSLAFVIPGIGILLCLHRALVVRSPSSALKDIGCLEKIKQSFVGRETDAANLLNRILSSNQVWLSGDSGVGKSMLLQRLILPELARRKIATVYLDFWNGDWDETPALQVLEKLGRHPKQKLLDSLEDALRSFHGVIILDQFDEFQIEHRDQFVSDAGKVISLAELESRNGFFRVLNTAVRERRVRSVFVTRRDVEWGKRPTLFSDATEFFLARIAGNVVEAEISRLISSEAVVYPESGWPNLRARLCDDLAADGVLPIQMRFAILGLEMLRNNLTLSAYLRQGGVDGLVSGYLEREVRRVSGNATLSREVFSLLDRLVTPDGKSTTAVAEAELFKGFSPEQCERARKLLAELQRSDIVRLVLSPGRVVLWRLDHDYLAAAVRSIVRRRVPEQWEIKEASRRFLAAVWWEKARYLASPLALIRYLRAMSRGLRFGTAAAWLLFSVSLWLFLAATATYVAWSRSQTSSSEERARMLFAEISQNVCCAPGERDPEARALRQLAAEKFSTHRAFLRISLRSVPNADRIWAHRHGMDVALTGINPDAIHALFQDPLYPVLANAQDGTVTWFESISMMFRWGAVQLATASQAHTITEKVVASIRSQESYETDPRDTASALSPLGGIDVGMSDALAERVVMLLTEVTQAEEMRDGDQSLVAALRALGSKVSTAKADELTAKLLKRVTSETNPYEFARQLAYPAAFRTTMSAKEADAMAAAILQGMSAQNASITELTALLVSLGDKVNADRIDAAAEKLVAELGPGGSEPVDVARALSALGKRVRNERIDAAESILRKQIAAQNAKAKPKPARSAKTGDADVDDSDADGDDGDQGSSDVAYLEAAVADLGRTVERSHIDAAVEGLVKDLFQLTKEEQDSGAPYYDLSVRFGTLANAISTDKANALAGKLVDAITNESDGGTIEALNLGLGAIGGRVSSEKADQLAASLVEAIARAKSEDVLYLLASGLTALSTATLTPLQLKRISHLLELPQAPCAVVLQLDSTIREAQVALQLHNPGCAESDWRKLALALAQMTGQSFARSVPALSNEEEDIWKQAGVEVDMLGLSKYLEGRRPWYNRVNLEWPEIIALVLLLGSVATFAGAMIEMPPRDSQAAAH